MKRAALYSSSRSRGSRALATAAPDVLPAKPDPWWRAALRRHKLLLAALPGVLALGFALLPPAFAPDRAGYTQEDIDAAVAKSLETASPPSPAAKAWETIRPSVVRVRGFGEQLLEDEPGASTNTGSGVIILDTGVILTNLHVVQGAKASESFPSGKSPAARA